MQCIERNRAFKPQSETSRTEPWTRWPTELANGFLLDGMPGKCNVPQQKCSKIAKARKWDSQRSSTLRLQVVAPGSGY